MQVRVVVDAWMVARALELTAYSRVAVNISAITLGDADACAQILKPRGQARAG